MRDSDYRLLREIVRRPSNFETWTLKRVVRMIEEEELAGAEWLARKVIQRRRLGGKS